MTAIEDVVRFGASGVVVGVGFEGVLVEVAVFGVLVRALVLSDPIEDIGPLITDLGGIVSVFFSRRGVGGTSKCFS